MSVLDVSSKFSFVSTRPICSPCGRYVAYVHSAHLIIREMDTLERARTVSLSKSHFVKVSQIVWEPIFEGKSQKVAVVLQNVPSVRIFDVEDEKCNVEILEDDTFGVTKVEWLPPSSRHLETAYKGSKQLVVYSECELMAKVYSLDYRRSPVLDIEKPLSDVITRNGEDLFSVISTREQKVVINTFVNSGSTSERLYVSELKNIASAEKFAISPGAKWLACCDSVLGKISISLFSVMGDITSSLGPLLKYVSILDPLGATDSQFVDDDTLLISDHTETIRVLRISQGFIMTDAFIHAKNASNSMVWRQSNDNSSFIKRSQPFTIPQIENLPLQSRGISKFKTSNDLIFSVTRSMPTTVFIWSLSTVSRTPIDILITNTRIKDVITSPALPGSFLIYTEDSICLWHSTPDPSKSQPISIPLVLDESIQLKGVQIANTTKTTIQLLIWTSDRSFYVIQSRLSLQQPAGFEHMDTQEISILRRGSPALIDDSSRVVDLAAGVQQSEWGQNLTKSLQVEDTFLEKKRARRLEPLIR